MRHDSLEPRFVKAVPKELEPGILYVSMEYGTVVHSCCCGCGLEVVTPLTPTDWELKFNGEEISLWPSVGSWNLPCRSHYVIDRNRVLEAGPWSEAQIEAQVARQRRTKEAYSGQVPSSAPSGDPGINAQAPKPVVETATGHAGLWARVRRWFGW